MTNTVVDAVAFTHITSVPFMLLLVAAITSLDNIYIRGTLSGREIQEKLKVMESVIMDTII